MSEKSHLKHAHLVFYLILVVILSFAVWLLYFFAGFPSKQIIVAFLTVFLYFLWGLAFHLYEGDFHLKIVIEYLLVALLALVLLKGAIFS